MNRNFKIFVCSLLFSLCVASQCLSADATEKNKDTVVKEASKEVSKEAAKVPSVFFPAPNFEFDQMVEGVELLHDFVIINKGTDILKIEKVKTG